MPKEYIYSTEYDLKLRFYPAECEKPLATIVFLYPSGYVACNFEVFKLNSEDLSKLGYNCVMGDYRVKNRDNSTPYDAIADAKDMYHYLIKNAEKFNIDPTKIVMAGSSAGGEMSLVCALQITEFDPAALVLYYPAIGMPSSEERSAELLKEKDRLPYYIMDKKLPKTIIFHGDADPGIPITNMRKFVDKAKGFGTDITLHEYAGRGHNFSNWDYPEDYADTLKKTVAFLDDMFK